MLPILNKTGFLYCGISQSFTKSSTLETELLRMWTLVLFHVSLMFSSLDRTLKGVSII